MEGENVIYRMTKTQTKNLKLIKKLLTQCTKDQQIFFWKKYGNINEIKPKSILQAIVDCAETVKYNIEKENKQL